MKLKDKVVIVTGAARGIGKATAIKFAQEGAKVVVANIRLESMDEVVAEIKEIGGEVLAYDVNVVNRDQIQVMVDDIISKWGRIDVLVNNAGITADNQLLKMPEEDFDKVIAVNLKGVYNCTQIVSAVMAEKGRGVILNASSVVGVYGNFGQTNYAATKFGVIGMTKTWAKELGRKGIRVNAVAPGFILTPMTEKMPEKVLELMKDKSPIRLLGMPEDIANAYAFLASDEAKFITGTVLSVDGGVVL
ncbi:3-oxoacyl-[acyl-carrier-protein] reductase [Alkaliphilus peptidifermentans]|uniref:3-oxoacyl-[acyl-carrier-protein] reductase n=1 Tax=Alkaliphilus peptidifermentans DSM 18978 TaxID=1120976 RepID=A0A1G5KHQ2_9FIRM|nr:3-oxoacyl-[acyl-carrier-protein] reductase [Alkaliphilus peptidifermentans]SCY99610.1 3-oxoacyl-[acyl-carrier-protein] reductase [Alkaliphilus peptidifermentans DSM 18978]